MKVGRALTAIWYGSGRPKWHPRSVIRRLVSWLFVPLSIVFRWIVSSRRRRFLKSPENAERMTVPVVVVGNLTVGGAGKTPLVIALIEALRLQGYSPGVVSRGYGGSETRDRSTIAEVEAATPDSADLLGDEPVLIARRTGAPVFVGRDRPATARSLLAAHPEVDVLLSDDGLQHYALARDFEIAVFDARGAGNGLLLPAGPLREPLSRLGEVDAIVLNGIDTQVPDMPSGVQPLNEPFRMELVPGEAYRVNDPTQVRTLDSFRGRRLTAAAGIGNPQRFFQMLRGSGLSFHRMVLDDHHRYSSNPFEWRNSEAVLMTEKDAVKCARFEEARMWAVPVTARIDASLVATIVDRIGAPRAVRP